MTGTAWDAGWFDTGMARLSMRAWRGVEAQHVVSTLRLVDNLQEQDLLEGLLERSKPAAPAMRSSRHYLLFTPFRYRPAHPSRFRRAGALGVWYGAEELQAACAEVAYWRHRFITDSAALAEADVLTEHTFFQAAVNGLAIDLMSPPWSQAREAWTRDRDYTQTQALAAAAGERAVQWIAYESVRAPGGRCTAVFDVEALDLVADGTTAQTWHCKANRRMVILMRGPERYAWSF